MLSFPVYPGNKHKHEIPYIYLNSRARTTVIQTEQPHTLTHKRFSVNLTKTFSLIQRKRSTNRTVLQMRDTVTSLTERRTHLAADAGTAYINGSLTRDDPISVLQSMEVVHELLNRNFKGLK